MTREEHSAEPAKDLDRLAADLETRFADDGGRRWNEAEFEAFAFEGFRHQFTSCVPYRGLCERRGVTPETVARWEDVPMVPATAFKHFELTSSDGRAPEAIFRTSGTTRGEATRGSHLVPRLSLYRASLLGPFRSALIPDLGSIPFLSLIPSPDHAPDSSLSYMVGAAADAFSSSTHWLVDAEGQWEIDAVRNVLGTARELGEPVLLLGTALSFVHLLERSPGLLGGLPVGSRIMETGGFKGARRTIPREELYREIAEATGVPTDRIVNEYGMTELLSQLYEPVLSEGEAAAGTHVPAPWLRVRALDPTTLEEVPEGDEGILAFFDLANLGSVSHVLTEDVGSVVRGRVRLRGRAGGSEPRGCSRAMDELMSAAASRA